MAPRTHAILSASSAHRWLNCSPSARLEQDFADRETEAAAEGTAAHALAEHKLRKALKLQTKKPISTYDSDEMDGHTDGYVQYVLETLAEAKKRCPDAILLIEQRLDFSCWVPDGFGTGDADNCLVTEADGKVVGAVWTRIMDDYGHVDDKTPSFAISLYRDYRGKGIGTAMMRRMLEMLKEQGYERASLAVRKANYAVRMYEKVGFRTIDENEEEYIMVCDLQGSAVEIHYRRLTLDDLETFIQMRINQLREEGATEDIDLAPALRDYYVRHMADGTFVSWLAVDGDKIIGTSGMSFVEKPPYYGCPSGRIGLLSSMFTDPSYRRRGIAKELLTKVVDEARAYGCGTVQITASDMGVLLYTDFGFVKNGNFMQYRL